MSPCKKAEALFNAAGVAQYEVSAWSASGQRSIHNLNYWQFGDYLAIGAGAHGKVTDATECTVSIGRGIQNITLNNSRTSDPPYSQLLRTIEPSDLPAEFMMNALRLKEGVDATLFEERTALSREVVRQNLEEQRRRGLMEEDTTKLKATARGYQYLDTLIEAFV